MKKQENKIAIIIPYFGKWPAWFEYFLLSCAYNSSVDWLLFSDCGKPGEIFDNTRFIDFTLDDFNRLASQKLDLSIKIMHPYKICDLRPAFGHIFSEYIKDYEFWGYGDIDLIYGNLNAHFIGELLNKHDILSNHDQFISGHLCLIRNMPETNLLYRKNGLYEDVFKASRARRIKVIFKDFIRSDRAFRRQGRRSWIISWQKGKLRDRNLGDELFAFHFVDSKNNPEFVVESVTDHSENFTISDLEIECVLNEKTGK